MIGSGTWFTLEINTKRNTILIKYKLINNLNLINDIIRILKLKIMKFKR